jgi:spore coat polysaccharide biosynthesis protein SpsF
MLVIVQARSSSRRFPRKILHRIYGKTLIEHVILKINKSKNVSNIVVATSKNKCDDNLVKLLKNNNINYFRGELKNVAKKTFACCRKI